VPRSMAEAEQPGVSEASGMSAIRKATRVMNVLAAGPMSTAELARRLGEPLPAVSRMLANLEAIGWVERSGGKGGNVQLGVELIAIGQAVEDSLDVRAIALSALVALTESTSETAYLCVRDGQRAACIERIDGRFTRTAEMPIGGSLPLHQGAGPRAILAFMPNEFRDRYVALLQASHVNPLSSQEARALADRLVAIRHAGISASDSEEMLGVYSVAAPVMNHRREVIGSITLSALQSPNTGASDFDELVRDHAGRVSRELGYRHERG
jgi:DNA-binding IclR family transcriptional regulator